MFEYFFTLDSDTNFDHERADSSLCTVKDQGLVLKDTASQRAPGTYVSIASYQPPSIILMVTIDSSGDSTADLEATSYTTRDKGKRKMQKGTGSQGAPGMHLRICFVAHPQYYTFAHYRPY